MVTATRPKREQSTLGRRRRQCPDASMFYDQCGHGNWTPLWVACNKWGCDPCKDFRLQNELVPEILTNLLYARDLGLTLKHVTKTWQGNDLGAANTKKGATRRRLDNQHFREGLRRKGHVYEALRVAETHKRGTVHFHELVVMPFIPQPEMSDLWKRSTRGAFKIDVEAVFMRCSRCWPGNKASRQEKKRSQVVPPPGKGECLNCGYRPNWEDEHEWLRVAQSCAQEAGKYLSKDLGEVDAAGVRGVVKKLTRTRGWKRVEKEPSPGSLCPACHQEHSFKYVGGKRVVASEYPESEAFHGREGRPCNCWPGKLWTKSTAWDVDDGIDVARRGLGLRAIAREPTEWPPVPWSVNLLTPAVIDVQRQEWGL